MDTVTHNLQNMLITTLQMTLINKFHNTTNDSNSIYALLFLTVFPALYFLIKYINETNDSMKNYLQYICYSYFKYKIKNQIEYSGKISIVTNTFDRDLIVSNNFSDNFKALWYYLNETIKTNNTIFQIKELNYQYNRYNKEGGDVFYMVSQKSSFIIDSKMQIYAYTAVKSEDTIDERCKTKNVMEKIHFI